MTQQQLINLTNTNLADNSNILPTELREVLTSIISTLFTNQQNYSVILNTNYTGVVQGNVFNIPSGNLIAFTYILNVCKIGKTVFINGHFSFPNSTQANVDILDIIDTNYNESLSVVTNILQGSKSYTNNGNIIHEPYHFYIESNKIKTSNPIEAGSFIYINSFYFTQE